MSLWNIYLVCLCRWGRTRQCFHNNILHIVLPLQRIRQSFKFLCLGLTIKSDSKMEIQWMFVILWRCSELFRLPIVSQAPGCQSGWGVKKKMNRIKKSCFNHDYEFIWVECRSLTFIIFLFLGSSNLTSYFEIDITFTKSAIREVWV